MVCKDVILICIMHFCFICTCNLREMYMKSETRTDTFLVHCMNRKIHFMWKLEKNPYKRRLFKPLVTCVADRSNVILTTSPYFLSVACLCASIVLNFDIPFTWIAFGHDFVWVTLCLYVVNPA